MGVKLNDDRKELIKKYGHLFTNTGGNDIVELIEREGINYFNNVVAAELQGCCWSQLVLLIRLRESGFLISEFETPAIASGLDRTTSGAIGQP